MGRESEVRYALAGPVGTITLDAPARRNALTTAMIDRLVDLLGRAAADPAVRVIVLSHTGPAFCAGLDLRASRDADQSRPPVAAYPDLLRAVVASPTPVLARVAGAARAGGIGLLAACDIVVAASTATFAFTEVRLGLVPAQLAATVLPRLSGAAGRELLLTGAVFDGARAAAIGLVDAAVSDVDTAVDRYVGALVRGAPGALAATKALLRQRPDLADLPALAALSRRCFAGAEGQEGLAAFAERRDPSWVPPDAGSH